MGENELYHYGVLGMKWGVRKEYKPVGRKPSSSALLTGATRKIKTPSGDISITKHGILDSKGMLERASQYSQKTKSEYLSKEEAESRLKNLKRANMHLTNQQQIDATNHKGENTVPLSSRNLRRINCFECTMAYEMRQRGYVCQANLRPGGSIGEVFHAFDVKDSLHIKAPSIEECYDQLVKECLAFGDGARGMIGFQYADYPSGHAMTWYVENGEFKIIDSQIGSSNGTETFMMGDGKVDVVRLDNAEVLPGVMDFVESFVPSLEEIEESKKRVEKSKAVLKRRTEERKAQIEADKKDQERRRKEAERRGMSLLEKGASILKGTIKTIINDGGKNIDDFISKGSEAVKNFLSNPLNAEYKIK